MYVSFSIYVFMCLYYLFMHIYINLYLYLNVCIVSPSLCVHMYINIIYVYI